MTGIIMFQTITCIWFGKSTKRYFKVTRDFFIRLLESAMFAATFNLVTYWTTIIFETLKD